jgi:hypothetical protein
MVKTTSAGTMITGKEDTNNFRLVTMASALRFNIKTGMQMTRGPAITTRIKQEFGLKGNKRSLYDQFTKMHGLRNRFEEDEKPKFETI